jgi:hypothetical protein
MGHLYYHTKKYSYFQPTTDKNDVKIRLGLNTALKSHQKVKEYPKKNSNGLSFSELD